MQKIDTTNPLDWIPYQNRWGRWVWRQEDIYADPTWPGLKPPSKDVHPLVKDGEWVWCENV